MRKHAKIAGQIHILSTYRHKRLFFFLLLASESKHHYQYRSIQTEYTSQDVDTQSRLKWWLKNSINIRDADMIAVTENLSSCEIKG